MRRLLGTSLTATSLTASTLTASTLTVSTLLTALTLFLLSGSPSFAESTVPDAAEPPSPPPEDVGRQMLRAELNPQLFPVPSELIDNIDFWFKVYTEYDNHVVLLHDEWHLGVIYAALDFSELDASGVSDNRKRKRRRDEIRKAREKYRHILSHLASGKTSKTYPNDQARVEALFADVPGGRSKYSTALNRLRTQTCLKNRFAEAIERSGIYMPTMEKIFIERGLPLELTRLPFVESLFQWHARSSAAAGGIWQFVPSTGRQFLRIHAELDERYDPIKSTDAAARFLADNFEALKTWPLALTAYNHGRNGMKRAVRKLGTRDLGTISQKYRSRTFGFASRNFYSEFVAAWRAYEDRAIHFPGTEPFPPLEFDEFLPSTYVNLPKLAQGASIDSDVLKNMNPALSREVWEGHLFFPKSYPLRVPAGSKETVEKAFVELPSQLKSAHQVGLRYQVRSGDTLGAIARKYGTSVGALQRANRLRGHIIRVGQKLLIPPSSRAGSSRVARAAVATSPGTHVVRTGENLSRIAGRYGTSVATIKSANRLRGDHITVGQRLTIPGADSASTHLVRSGESLAKIAGRYGVSVSALRKANKLSGDLIRPGQVLFIP